MSGFVTGCSSTVSIFADVEVRTWTHGADWQRPPGDRV
jgi:hypothetical protein